MLNNNDDAAGALVIEPAVTGVIVPIVGCVALGFRDRFIGLQRVINNMEPYGRSFYVDDPSEHFGRSFPKSPCSADKACNPLEFAVFDQEYFHLSSLSSAAETGVAAPKLQGR
jgi:hypothetical protein